MSTPTEHGQFKFLSIEKLTEDNYVDWSIHQTDILIVQGLFDIVSPPAIFEPDVKDEDPKVVITPTPTVVQSAATKSALVRRDQLAMAQIRLNVSPSLMVHIRTSSSAKQAWDTLRNVCQPTGGAVPFQRINTFFSCKPDAFPTLASFVTALKERKVGCEQVDIPISDIIYKYQLISNLPSSCAILKEILINQLKDLSEQDIEAKVLDFGRRHESDEETVLVAAKTEAGSVSKFKCSGCGKTGHTLDGDANGKRRCFKKYPQDLAEKRKQLDPSSQQSSSTSPQANYAGHWVADEEYINLSAMKSVLSPVSQYSWIVDCGASSHFCKDPAFFSHLSALIKPMPIRLGNNSIVSATHVGAINLQLASSTFITMNTAYLVPKLSVNLFSLGQASNEGIDSSFSSGRLKLINSTSKEVITTLEQGGNKLYSFSAHPACEQCNLSMFEQWHRNLGHVNSKYLETMSKRKLVKGLPENLRKPPGFFCISCTIGKSKAHPHHLNLDRATVPLMVVKGDLQGPFPLQSILGHLRYTFNLYDQATSKR